MVERVVAEQLQAFLGDVSILEPFQSSFGLDHKTEMVLVILKDIWIEVGAAVMIRPGSVEQDQSGVVAKSDRL